LIKTIKKALKFNERRFHEFRQLSLSFRQGKIKAEEFCSHIVALFKEAASSMFPILIEFLSDDDQKRQELLAVYHDKKITWVRI
jgi:hypothetical protein